MPNDALPEITPDMPFEHALEGLETVIRGMQAQDAELLESIESYERGVAYQKVCELRLKEAEARIEEIKNRTDKSEDLTLAPFGDGTGREQAPAAKPSAKATPSAHDSDPEDNGELF